MNQLLMRRRAAIASQEPDYLKFTALANNSSVRFFWYAQNDPYDTRIEYRINGGQWTQKSESNTNPISLSQGDVMEVRKYGDPIPALCKSNDNTARIQFTGSIAASGNVMSLIDKTCTQLTCGAYCFNYLFYNQSALVTPPYLPAVSLGSYAYQRMFSQCRNLVEAPYLPSEYSDWSTYRYIFSRDISLKSIRMAHFPDYALHIIFPGPGETLILESFIIENTTPPLPTNNISDWTLNNLPSTCKIYVPWSADHRILNAYKVANGWIDYADRIYELDEHGNVPQQINE